MRFKINKQFLLVVLIFTLVVSTVTARGVKTGVEILREQNFSSIKGKRVGLITNPTGVDRNLSSTVDLFFHSKEIRSLSAIAK